MSIAYNPTRSRLRAPPNRTNASSLSAGADPKLVRSGNPVGGEAERPCGGRERGRQDGAGVLGAGQASRNALAAGDELFLHDRLRYHAGMVGTHEGTAILYALDSPLAVVQ